MRSLLPDIPGATQTHRANPLGNGALNTRSLGIDLGKFLGRFPLSPLFQGEVLLLRTNRDGATRMATRLCTQRSRRAYLTVFHRELDLDDLVFPVVNGRGPTDARVSLWAGCLLLFPIDGKVTDVEARRLEWLAIGSSFGLVLPDQSGSPAGSPPGVVRLHSLYPQCAEAGQERFAFKLGMNGCRHGIIRDRS